MDEQRILKPEGFIVDNGGQVMEWTIVSVLVVLIGLVAAIAKPMLSWNTNMTENTMAIKALTETIKGNETRNEKEHCEIWTELGAHDERISHIEKGAK